ncbi:MAG: transcriptional regulator Crp, partial [Silanimonas sp.]
MIQTASATLLTPTVRSQVASSPLDLDKATLARFLDQCHRRKYPNRTDVFR